MTQDAPAARPDQPLPAETTPAGVSGPANPAQDDSGPFGWVLWDRTYRRVTAPVQTEGQVLETVRLWDERYPAQAGRFAAAQIIPAGGR